MGTWDMKARAWFAAAALAWATGAWATGAAEFGTPGGPAPANLEEVADFLRQDPYDLELLISFGTSKGGSAGHLALAIRDQAAGDDLVYSANFYADREPEHEGRYNAELMVRVPKKEYLYGTRSSLGEKASFGLDFGEAYKRSVIGVRVYGVPAREREALASFFAKVNDDFRARARWTDYHAGETRYGYLDLNCAKTIGAAFRHGAGYEGLEVKSAWPFARIRVLAALAANIPTEMALKLMREWHARGYAMDAVLYRKFEGSPWVDPLEEEKVAFRDLPDRFPSVLSRDFRREHGEYEDYDNLFAMYLFYNLGRYGVRVDAAAGRLVIERSKSPMDYPRAVALADESARSDSESYGRRGPFRPRGHRVGEPIEDGQGPAR
jgi:hypothetical protein